MINLYNLQFGLMTLLGDMVNQLTMFLIVAFFVRPAQQACLSDTQDNQYIYQEQLRLWVYQCCFHFAAFVVMTFRERAGDAISQF